MTKPKLITINGIKISNDTWRTNYFFVFNCSYVCTECPTLPAASLFKESFLRSALSKIMTILLNKSEKSDAFDEDNTATRVSAMRQNLLLEFEKIENDSKPVIAADILMFYIHISFSYGWISRASIGFLAVLSICPTAAKIRDANGCLPIHLICNHKTNRYLLQNIISLALNIASKLK